MLYSCTHIAAVGVKLKGLTATAAAGHVTSSPASNPDYVTVCGFPLIPGSGQYVG